MNDYLQKKQSYVTGKVSFEGTQVLYKAGAISLNDYISEQTQHDDAVLNYYQAQYQLEKILDTAHIDPKTIENLSLADTERVNTVLEKHFKNIVITAPSTGVALFPPPNTAGNNGGDGRIREGRDIKERQVILSFQLLNTLFTIYCPACV